tara:strand:- start:3450 stop:3656 length:207 start_codon:yes stop_codon:yes gene_type:complete
MRCKCKENYTYPYIHEKGEWYTYTKGEIQDIFYVDHDDHYLGFYDEEFKKNFYTEQEARELEIDKVLR